MPSSQSASSTKTIKRIMAPPRRPKSTTNASGIGWHAVIIIGALAITYVNSLGSPFLFDDTNSIVNNPQIRQIGTSLTPPRETPVAGRPLVNLSFALNFAAHGLSVTGYHVTNVAIHIAAALVLFGLVRRTLLLPRLARYFGRGSADIALACALLWGLHPLNTESVNYLTQRSESLMGLCYLLTLYSSLRGWRTASVAFCAAGMLCKESMVTAPLMVVLYDRVFVFNSFREALRVRRAQYGGLAASWLVLAGLLAGVPRTSIGFDTGTRPSTYLLNQVAIVCRYLMLSFWPRALVLDYGLPQTLTLGAVLMPGIAIATLIAATLAAFRYAPMLGFLGAWFFVTLAPTSSIVPIATEVGAERRMYLPLIAVVVLIVTIVARAFSRDQPSERTRLSAAAFRMTVGALCLALAGATMVRNREYASRLTLAETIVERRPHGRGRYFLALELMANGRKNEAIQQLQLSVADYPAARFALGTELLAEGKAAEAVSELRAFLRAFPNHVNSAYAHDMLGRLYLAQGQFSNAVQEYRTIEASFPGYRGMHDDIAVNLGYALAASGRLTESIPVLERAIAANPDNTKARDLLAHVRADGLK